MNKNLQKRFLKLIKSGLINSDSNIGLYVTHPEDYQIFSIFTTPIINEYHRIDSSSIQSSDWSTSLGDYLLSSIDQSLQKSSIRARVAKNVAGWPFTTAMTLAERLNFETYMQGVLDSIDIDGEYFSLTPGHKK